MKAWQMALPWNQQAAPAVARATVAIAALIMTTSSSSASLQHSVVDEGYDSAHESILNAAFSRRSGSSAI
jgi:hypothetical protein